MEAVMTMPFNPWSNAAEWSHGIPPEIFPPDAAALTALLGCVRRPGMVALEVGSWVGNGSTRVLVEGLRAVGGTLYCVDTWEGSDNVRHHAERHERHGDLFTVFADNVSRYGGRRVVRPLVKPSVAASRLFPDGSLDLVFIDGNHGYSHVKQDVLAWLPKVSASGVLCGHDCDARYADLDPALRHAIEGRCEEDVFENDRYPGPRAFHGGVVKAVHEIFGGRARLWFERERSTVWSYRPGGRLGRLYTLLRKHTRLFEVGDAAGRGQLPEPTQWPAEPEGRYATAPCSTA
jgi:hypothetical protein